MISRDHPISDDDYVIMVNNQRIWLSDGERWQLRTVAETRHQIGENNHFIFVDFYNDRRCYVVSVDQPENQWVSLRTQLPLLSFAEWQLASRALQLITWDKQHRYCGQCGRQTVDHDSDLARYCHSCDISFYPRVSPCMMCLIVRDDYCLLAHHYRQPEGMYSTLAGFVEAGESVEQTVHREIKEEVGLTVDNLRYYASQQWPFPHQLMVAFFADYVAGDIHIDDVEIADARWFRYDRLPIIPPIQTISGQLIRAFVNSRQ